METAQRITIGNTVNAPVDKVWELYNNPDHVTKWNQASPDWHSPSGKNDLREGGSFTYRMEAKDGSFGFDFGGVYDRVKENELIEYTMSDGRKVKTTFEPSGNTTKVTTVFDAETTNSVELQQTGWQAILDSFKSYVEKN